MYAVLRVSVLLDCYYLLLAKCPNKLKFFYEFFFKIPSTLSFPFVCILCMQVSDLYELLLKLYLFMANSGPLKDLWIKVSAQALEFFFNKKKFEGK